MKLSFSEKVGYALGDAGANFFWKTMEFFLLFFYTDVFGISALEAGTLFLVTRVVDAITDPVMGLLADRTRTRFGSFRPYLLLGIVPLAVLGGLTFSVPSLSGSAKLAYAYVTYILLMVAYTVVNVPYSALLGVLTDDPLERAKVSAYRFAAAFLAALFVQFFTLKLVARWGGSSQALGFSRVVWFYGGLAALLTILCFFLTKERVTSEQRHEGRIGRDLRVLLTSRPFLVLAGVAILVITSFSIRGASLAYFFQGNLREAEWLGVKGGADLLGWFFVSGGVSGFLGVLLTSRVIELFGKKGAYFWPLLISNLLLLPLSWLGPREIAWVFLLNILANLVLGSGAPILFSMFGDVADETELRTSLRLTGLVYSASLFALKLGGALGGFLAGFFLDRVGYLSGAALTEGTRSGIAALVGHVPSALGLLSALAFLAYPIGQEELTRISSELVSRRKSRSPLDPTPPGGHSPEWTSHANEGDQLREATEVARVH